MKATKYDGTAVRIAVLPRKASGTPSPARMQYLKDDLELMRKARHGILKV